MDETEGPPITAPPTDRRSSLSNVLETLQTQSQAGKTDPLVMMLVMSELRRWEREDERMEWEREKRANPPPPPPPQPPIDVDVEDIINKLDAQWERRVTDQTHRFESLLLGKKLEEVTDRAESAERTLKESHEQASIETFIDSTVEKRIRGRLANIPPANRKGFLEDIMGDVEDELKNVVKDAVIDRLTGSGGGGEVTVTGEGGPRLDLWKALNRLLRTVDKGIDAYEKAASRSGESGAPPVKDVETMPPLPDTGEKTEELPPLPPTGEKAAMHTLPTAITFETEEMPPLPPTEPPSEKKAELPPLPQLPPAEEAELEGLELAELEILRPEPTETPISQEPEGIGGEPVAVEETKPPESEADAEPATQSED